MTAVVAGYTTLQNNPAETYLDIVVSHDGRHGNIIEAQTVPGIDTTSTSQQIAEAVERELDNYGYKLTAPWTQVAPEFPTHAPDDDALTVPLVTHNYTGPVTKIR